MNYSENYQIRKSVKELAGTGANYVLEYTVKNETGKAVDSITVIISEKKNEDGTDKLTRVGCASVDKTNDRSYFAIDQFANVTVENQAKLAAQFFSDVQSILE